MVGEAAGQLEVRLKSRTGVRPYGLDDHLRLRFVSRPRAARKTRDDEPHGHAQLQTPRDCVGLPRIVWYSRAVVTASTIVPMDSTTRVGGTGR